MDDRLFHKPGLIYFWALNDECRPEKMDAMVGKSTMGTVTHLVGTLRIMPIMAGIMAGSLVGIILVGIPVGILVGI